MNLLQKRLENYAKQIVDSTCPVCEQKLLAVQISDKQGTRHHYQEHLHYIVSISCKCSLKVKYIYCENDDAGKTDFPALSSFPLDALKQKTMETMHSLHWDIRGKVGTEEFEKIGYNRTCKLNQYAQILQIPIQTYLEKIPTWSIPDFQEKELEKWLAQTE